MLSNILTLLETSNDLMGKYCTMIGLSGIEKYTIEKIVIISGLILDLSKQMQLEVDWIIQKHKDNESANI